MTVVLDADVVIGALDGADVHHRQARSLFGAWRKQDVTRLMSVINLSEVLVAPSADRTRLRTAREAIRTLGIKTQQPSEAIGVDAARLRQHHPISLPDAYCLATARHTGALLASFDRTLLRAAEREHIVCVPTRP